MRTRITLLGGILTALAVGSLGVMPAFAAATAPGYAKPAATATKPMAAKPAKPAAVKPAAKTVTVTGEVVDLNCYFRDGKAATGPKHAACAQTCANAGAALGILTKTGKLYVNAGKSPSGDGDDLKAWAGKTVAATGTVHTQSGVTALVVTSVKEAAAAPMKPAPKTGTKPKSSPK